MSQNVTYATFRHMTQIRLTVNETAGAPTDTVTRLHDGLERAGFVAWTESPGVTRAADEPTADWVTFLAVDLDPVKCASCGDLTSTVFHDTLCEHCR